MPNTMAFSRHSLAEKFLGVIDAYTRLPKHNAPPSEDSKRRERT